MPHSKLLLSTIFGGAKLLPPSGCHLAQALDELYSFNAGLQQL